MALGSYRPGRDRRIPDPSSIGGKAQPTFQLRLEWVSAEFDEFLIKPIIWNSVTEEFEIFDAWTFLQNIDEADITIKDQNGFPGWTITTVLPNQIEIDVPDWEGWIQMAVKPKSESFRSVSGLLNDGAEGYWEEDPI